MIKMAGTSDSTVISRKICSVTVDRAGSSPGVRPMEKKGVATACVDAGDAAVASGTSSTSVSARAVSAAATTRPNARRGHPITLPGRSTPRRVSSIVVMVCRLPARGEPAQVLRKRRHDLGFPGADPLQDGGVVDSGQQLHTVPGHS